MRNWILQFNEKKDLKQLFYNIPRSLITTFLLILLMKQKKSCWKQMVWKTWMVFLR